MTSFSKNQQLWPVVLLVVALGLFFRVYGLGARDLWTDEAWVALAVQQPSPAAVLAAGKSTPPFYLLTVWAFEQMLGRSETVLRLTSVLFGLGTLLLAGLLARSRLQPGAALAAFSAVAISTRLVYFSKELKQYSSDAFFAVLALVLMERILQQRGQGGWLAFFVAMALGLGYSHALLFTLPIVAVILWWHLAGAGLRLTAAFGTLGLIFAVYYRLFFQGQIDPELVNYWQQDFPDLSGVKNFFLWFFQAWERYLRYFFGDRGWLPGLAFLLIGGFSLLRQATGRLVFAFLGSLALALAAAWLHRYPFMAHAGGNRLMLFSAPLLYIIVGVGVMAAASWVWRQNRVWLKLILLAGLLVWVNPVQVWQENLHPQANLEQIRPLARYLETHRQEGDPVYVYYFTIDPFKYYYNGPLDGVIWGRSCHEKALCLPLGPAGGMESKRLWLIFSHFEALTEVDSFIHCLLGDGWTREKSFLQPGAALFSYIRR